MVGRNVEEGNEGDGEGNEGEGKGGDEESDESVDGDNENTNAKRSERESGRGRCYGDEVDDDDVGSDMARSDILISPPISSEENEVYSFARCVTGDRTKIYTRNSTNRFAIKWLCRCEVEPTENWVCVKLI